jgi:hypothetical protein
MFIMMMVMVATVVRVGMTVVMRVTVAGAAMTVVMAMILRVGMTGMAVPMIMRIMGGGIGPAFGVERRLDLDDAGAQPLHHLLDDVIAADAQTPARDLRRQMPIAKMPGDPHQMRGIRAPDLDERLGCGDHLDQPAILQHQRVAAAEGYGVLQIKQEFEAARTRHRHPPAMAVVEIKHHGIGRRFDPPILPPNLRRPDHTTIP